MGSRWGIYYHETGGWHDGGYGRDGLERRAGVVEPHRHVLRRAGLVGVDRADDVVGLGNHTNLGRVLRALAMKRRLGVPEVQLLIVQNNLANSYQEHGQSEQALHMRRDVYSAYLKLNGEENISTIRAANNYASSLNDLQRFEEAKSLFSKWVPVARRVIGEGAELVLAMRRNYAAALTNAGTTLDDLREAVAMFEETERATRRVLGGAHPLTVDIERRLREARAVVRIREYGGPLVVAAIAIIAWLWRSLTSEGPFVLAVVVAIFAWLFFGEGRLRVTVRTT
jgi:tetratricopeptide (TPR) repeat protein